MFRPVALACLALCLAAPAFAGSASAARAEQLYQRARTELARRTIDTRRLALRDLEEAAGLAPERADIELLLARTYQACGFLRSARQHYERVTALDPGDADGQFGLAQIWFRDWRKFLDPKSFDHAIDHLSAAARLQPGRAELWLTLVPLMIEEHRLAGASLAIGHALAADSTAVEVQLAAGLVAWHQGDVTRADSFFTLAVPRLEKNIRARFDDIAPVASAADTAALHHLPAAQQPDFVRRFWDDSDPDPATPENEARLEYWARVAQAYFLYYDRHRREWDERGEVYVRYGPPTKSTYNPVNQNLNVHFGTGADYPANVLMWEYPDLGMNIIMQDRLLSEYYLLPMSQDSTMDPQPDPDSLAKRTGMLATANGRGVFHTLPPGFQPMPVQGLVSAFESAVGGRVLAQLAVASGPSVGRDTLAAEWVVMDSLRHVIARATRPLEPSTCDPAASGVSDFDADLPPGDYLVGVSVRNGRQRGIYREHLSIGAPARSLALSDVVPACGPPEVRGTGAERRLHLEPNAARQVAAGEPLNAYFEIYHLQPGPDSLAHFSYDYTVRSAEKDRRIWIQRALSPRPQIPPLEARREEANPGSMRRQFITVPVQSLPAGRYRLEIAVRDLIDGDEAKASMEFLKEGAAKTP